VEQAAVDEELSDGMALIQLQEQPIQAAVEAVDLSIKARMVKLVVLVSLFFVIQTAAQSLLVQVLLVLKVLQAVAIREQQLLLAQEM
jgi:hypothetical protein